MVLNLRHERSEPILLQIFGRLNEFCDFPEMRIPSSKIELFVSFLKTKLFVLKIII